MRHADFFSARFGLGRGDWYGEYLRPGSRRALKRARARADRRLGHALISEAA